MTRELIVSLAAVWLVSAPFTATAQPEPVLEILRPGPNDRLQPGTLFRIQWRAVGVEPSNNGDWNFFLETNGVHVGRLFPDVMVEYGGNSNWHAYVTIPNEVHPHTRWDVTRVPLASACNYTLRIHEDGSEADGRSQVSCLGVPVASLRVSPVEFCWTSRTNRMYQVQYRSQLTNVWTSLGGPVQGNGTTNCITDAVIADQPQRFYRVAELP